ncbi:MAG: hypothetical protein HY738_16925 [Bacteroidia bacterium]|nr:hypothetical protein [Bacteroidia bacterium]
MRKHLIYILLAIFLISTALLTGCLKKGDEDPFVSLRTRKARVVGNWTITDKIYDVIIKYPGGESVDSTFTLSGTSCSVREAWHQMKKDTIHNWKGSVTEATFEFDEDGGMQLYVVFNISRDSINVTQEDWTYETFWKREYRCDFRGTWNFLNKIDNYKNKERITYVWTTMITTVTYDSTVTVTDADGNIDIRYFPSQMNEARKYANGQVAEIWELIQLRNKAIKLFRDINEDWVYKFQDSQGNFNTNSLVVTGLESMTLTAKE